jgi:hypothetical protein
MLPVDYFVKSRSELYEKNFTWQRPWISFKTGEHLILSLVMSRVQRYIAQTQAGAPSIS